MQKLLLVLLIFLPYAFSETVKEIVTSLLKYEEGKHDNGICYPYRDSLGYPTIGYGTLCSNKNVTSDEEARSECSSYVSSCTEQKANQWLSDGIDSKTSCINEYSNIKAAYDKASDYRKAIIISMAYQLGCNGLSKFTKTLDYMANEQWSNAATEMLDSLWYKQTPKRAERHSYVILNNNCGDFCKNYGWSFSQTNGEPSCSLDHSEGATPEFCKGLIVKEEFIKQGQTHCCYFEGKRIENSYHFNACIPVSEESYKDEKILHKFLNDNGFEVYKTVCGEKDGYSYYLNIGLLSLLFIIL